MAEKTVSVRLNARVEQYLAAMKSAAAATGLTTAQLNNMSRVGGQLQRVGGQLSRYVSLPLAAVGVVAVHSAMQWETSFAQMQGLASVTADEVDGLKESVLDLAGETARSPQELADGLYLAASAGLDSAAAMDVVTVAAHAAAAGMGSSATVVDLLTTVLGSYGAENITAAHAADILTAAVREGKAEPDAMAQSLGRILPIAASMGITFEETAGSVAFLTNAGLDTDEAVTALRGTMLALLDPTKEARKALEDAGTSVEEVHNAIAEDGLLGALELLREHGFVAGSEALSNLIEDNRALVGATVLLDDASGQLVPTLDAVAQSGGALGDAFSVVADTDAFKMKQALTELQVAMISIGEIILPIAAQVGSAIADLAGWFADLPAPIQTVVAILGGMAAAAGPVLMIAGSLIRNWQSLSSVMGASASVFRTASLALGGIALAVTAGYFIYQQFTKSQRETKAETQLLSAALDTQGAALFRAAIEAGKAQTAVGALSTTMAVFSQVLIESGSDGKAAEEALGQLGFQVDDLAGIINGLRDEPVGALHMLARETEATAPYFDVLAQAVNNNTGDVDTLATLLRTELNKQLGLTGEALDQTTAELLPAAAAMDTLQNVAAKTDIDALFRGLLNTAVASGEAGEGLVAAAEAATGFSRSGDQVIQVYLEYLRLLANADQATQDAVMGTNDLAGANTDLAGALSDTKTAVENSSAAWVEAEGVAASTIDTMSDAEQAFADAATKANLFSDALHSIIDPAVDYNEAIEAVWKNALGFAGAIDENSRSLDVSSEAGLKNRDVIEGWAESIIGATEAQVANGDSIYDITNAWYHNIAALRQTALDAGFAEDQVDELLATYHMTPSGLSTVIQLYGQKVAKADVEAYIATLGDIDADVVTAIEAEIDRGAYGYAKTMLESLAAPQSTTVTAYADIGPAKASINSLQNSSIYVTIRSAGANKSAVGRYVPANSNMLTTVAEPGAGAEVILPLDNPSRMAQLLGMSEVGPKIAAAMGAMGMSGGGGGSSAHLTAASVGGGSTAVYNYYNTVHMPPGSDGDDVVRALRDWQRRRGPVPITVR